MGQQIVFQKMLKAVPRTIGNNRQSKSSISISSLYSIMQGFILNE